MSELPSHSGLLKILNLTSERPFELAVIYVEILSFVTIDHMTVTAIYLYYYNYYNCYKFAPTDTACRRMLPFSVTQ